MGSLAGGIWLYTQDDMGSAHIHRVDGPGTADRSAHWGGDLVTLKIDKNGVRGTSLWVASHVGRA